RDAPGNEVRVHRSIRLLVPPEQLRHRLVRATVVEHRDLGEIQDRQAEALHVLDLALDPDPQRLPRVAGHQAGVERGHGPPHQGGQVETDGHQILAPDHRRRSLLPAPTAGRLGAPSTTRFGSSMKIWLPGKYGRPSSRGGASSQSGMSAIRAVPLRIENFAFHFATRRRICWIPWPRPGSWKRVRPWMKAA